MDRAHIQYSIKKVGLIYNIFMIILKNKEINFEKYLFDILITTCFVYYSYEYKLHIHFFLLTVCLYIYIHISFLFQEIRIPIIL